MKKIIFILLMAFGLLKAQTQDTASVIFQYLPESVRIDTTYILLAESPSLAYKVTWKNLQRSMDFSKLVHTDTSYPDDYFALTHANGGLDTVKGIKASNLYTSLLRDSVTTLLGTATSQIYGYVDSSDSSLLAAINLIANVANWDSVNNRLIEAEAGILLNASYIDTLDGEVSTLSSSLYLYARKDSIISSINITPESIKIAANKITFTGDISVVKQELADSLSYGATMIDATQPTMRPDHTTLKEGDVWLDSDDSFRRYVRSGGAWVGVGDSWILPTYTNGSSMPGSPDEGDWHFWTGAEGTYHRNTWYRYTSGLWTASGLFGTYITDTGVYTGELAANQIIAGTGIVNNLSVLSTLTMGSASTTGTIKSYGWNGTANGFQIVGGSSPSFSLIGGTITGGTYQTRPNPGSGDYTRIVINSTDNRIDFYDGSNNLNYLYSFSDFIAVDGLFYATGGFVCPGNVNIANGSFYVNGGALTKVDNKAASSYSNYALISDGYSYTPRAIAATDIDANVSNTEFSYLNGVTSAIQTQLNGKQATITTTNTAIGGSTPTGGSDADMLRDSSTGNVWLKIAGAWYRVN